MSVWKYSSHTVSSPHPPLTVFLSAVVLTLLSLLFHPLSSSSLLLILCILLWVSWGLQNNVHKHKRQTGEAPALFIVGKRREKNSLKNWKRSEIITACIFISAPTLIVEKSESWENSPPYADALWCCHSHGEGLLIKLVCALEAHDHVWQEEAIKIPATLAPPSVSLYVFFCLSFSQLGQLSWKTWFWR